MSALQQELHPGTALVWAAAAGTVGVLVPVAARQVSRALPGPAAAAALAAPLLFAWLAWAWVGAVPLALSVALHGGGAGPVPKGPFSWLALYVNGSAGLAVRCCWDLARPALDETGPPGTAEPTLGGALLGAALLVVPWRPVLVTTPAAVLVVLLLVLLRLVRSGLLPAPGHALPEAPRRVIRDEPGLAWLALAALTLLLSQLLLGLADLGTTTSVAASAAVGLLVALLAELGPEETPAPDAEEPDDEPVDGTPADASIDTSEAVAG